MILLLRKELMQMENKQVQENYARISAEIAEAALKSNRKPEEIAFMAVTKQLHQN